MLGRHQHMQIMTSQHPGCHVGGGSRRMYILSGKGDVNSREKVVRCMALSCNALGHSKSRCFFVPLAEAKT